MRGNPLIREMFHVTPSRRRNYALSIGFNCIIPRDTISPLRRVDWRVEAKMTSHCDANLNRKFVRFYCLMLCFFSGGSIGVVLAFDSIPSHYFISYFVL